MKKYKEVIALLQETKGVPAVVQKGLAKFKTMNKDDWLGDAAKVIENRGKENEGVATKSDLKRTGKSSV